MSVAVIVTAAGSGSRLGHALPKALVPLGGIPLVVHAVRAMVEGAAASVLPAERLDRVVVTAPPDRLQDFRDALDEAGLVAHGAEARVEVVPGAGTRQGSVDAGLATLPPEVDVVLVHDAARALVPPDVVRAVLAAVRAGHRAVVPALAVTDTIKRVTASGADGKEGWPVVETVPREQLRAVQTPQGFSRGLLARAHDAGRLRAHDEAAAVSDDAGLVEALGEPVWVVPGHADAVKITTPWDLAVAELLLAGRGPTALSQPNQPSQPSQPQDGTR
ncbi:2-C-methyl-D-erythritol 4-phosphate cytidylyltransferase [Cellulomonas chengniuliangii]|uniref:2-C-methyl-D-erythritol 4-phosphate cytidylyltransferase n=1 Tax=Cellulomonas chengniuliangii TaxID=2968084 RepID=A0ABY5L329_9CELL|nr:2-C-methyl-D-erythritol 4-phosphate cytidylyltransferase [Cellulomonas chengniuliangii]MCC2307346.1 2-C-methyl-D-erythritol 4-phosphate cytidylyltransferase [Cellulomonas chengniuliangii]MCC2317758.1 2-C-methyl-D-erythritol 4-phosphate cytidylyltransferase [Cellulomonas chengniuliangii]UUI75865.1 2-C-methyl-D-erythritol 4-phosphate cytidylyltransferase [Cellulomonas chengniuliangii]